jgi:SAM-dependent methyltransferase
VRGRPVRRRVLDLGCGTGRDAGYLAGLGHDVVGLDASARMLDHARRHHPRVTFLPGRMESFSLGQTFDVITCLDSSLLYCHDNDALAAMFSACRHHLVPGGLLIAEMRNGAYYLGAGRSDPGPAEHVFTWRGVRYQATSELWIDHAAQLLRRRRSWTWTGRGGEPLVQESAWRLLFPQELRYVLAHTGFEVRALFDAPGPRTTVPWRDDAPLDQRLRGRRLHLVAVCPDPR